MKRDIFVFASWAPLSAPERIGILSASYARGKELYSFEYDEKWLARGELIGLDPDIAFQKGRNYPSGGKTIFGIFADASPDRWGRRLMMRREKIQAKAEGRAEKNLLELDFLLGVDDSGRMGGLRFKEDLQGPFLEDDRFSPTPPFTDLRKLESAALAFERDDAEKADEAVLLLLRPGGSLGGARPKANVKDPSGSIWIAKFPSESDFLDVGGWEEVTAILARAAGISMPESKALKLASKHHTFLSRRFDRTGETIRYAYASAMTLLGKQDGQSGETSYLDLAELLIAQGGTARIQLTELWRRIVFAILVSHTDDKLRNHGFLYNFEKRGWDLSPAFDINPILNGKGLTLSIDEGDNSLSLELARSVAPYFHLKKDDAEEIISHVRRAVEGWRVVAKKVGIKPSEIEMMAAVFEKPNN